MALGSITLAGKDKTRRDRNDLQRVKGLNNFGIKDLAKHSIFWGVSSEWVKTVVAACFSNLWCSCPGINYQNAAKFSGDWRELPFSLGPRHAGRAFLRLPWWGKIFRFGIYFSQKKLSFFPWIKGFAAVWCCVHFFLICTSAAFDVSSASGFAFFCV